MYYIQTIDVFFVTINSSIVEIIIEFDNIVWKWHQKLDYLSWKNIRRLLKQNERINLIDKQIKAKIKIICLVCTTTKVIVKILRDFVKRRYKKLNELLIINTWKLYFIIEINEIRYELFNIDNVIKNTWVKFYSKKDEIFQVLKQLCKNVEITYNVTIRRFWYDNEFQQVEIYHFVFKTSITIKLFTFYSYYQIKTQKRANKTFREKTTILIQKQTSSKQIIKIITKRSREMLRITIISKFL